MSDIVSRIMSEPNTTPARRRTSLAVVFGYVLLFLSTVVFDQSSKFHAESSFMVWSHETDIRAYRGAKEHVFTLGVSPALARS